MTAVTDFITSLINNVSIYSNSQKVQVYTSPNEAVDVSHLKTGSYFINIVSDKSALAASLLKNNKGSRYNFGIAKSFKLMKMFN